MRSRLRRIKADEMSAFLLVFTLSAMNVISLEGLVLLLGVDRFMSEACAIVNLIGNGIATVVVAKSENEFDDEKYKRVVEEMKREKLPGKKSQFS